MANTVKSKNDSIEKKEKKTVETTNNINADQNVDTQQILKIISDLQEQVKTLKKQNEELQTSAPDNDVSSNENTEMLNVEPLISSVSNVLPDKVRVYHTMEMLGGTTTYINLSRTTRALRQYGQLMTLDINDFEELVGKYKSFFDSGILAIGSDNIEYAELYGLPVFDNNTKEIFSNKKLSEVIKYSRDQLQDFYNSLSETMKHQFLSFWLGKVYEKIDGYYDVEKMRWLNSISGTGAFLPIIVEIENNERRGRVAAIDANQI